MRNPNVYWDLYRQAKEGSVTIPEGFSNAMRDDYIQIVEAELRPLLALRHALQGFDAEQHRAASVASVQEPDARRNEFSFVPEVPLKVGMVGVLKYDDDIKKSLQGRAFRIIEEHPLLEQCAVCSIEGKDGTYMVYAGQMHTVGYPAEVLGDVFETKQVDGHILAVIERDELVKALEQAPVGTVITGVRDAPGTFGYGRYDFDTKIEKHSGYIQNYFAPMPTKNYETWWTVDGSKKNVYEMADIFLGRSKYYALTQVQPSIDDKLNDASRRSREGDKEFESVLTDKVFE